MEYIVLQRLFSNQSETHPYFQQELLHLEQHHKCWSIALQVDLEIRCTESCFRMSGDNSLNSDSRVITLENSIEIFKSGVWQLTCIDSDGLSVQCVDCMTKAVMSFQKSVAEMMNQSFQNACAGSSREISLFWIKWKHLLTVAIPIYNYLKYLGTEIKRDWHPRLPECYEKWKNEGGTGVRKERTRYVRYRVKDEKELYKIHRLMGFWKQRCKMFHNLDRTTRRNTRLVTRTEVCRSSSRAGSVPIRKSGRRSRCISGHARGTDQASVGINCYYKT